MPKIQDLTCYGCVHDGWFNNTVSEDCKNCIRCYSGIEALIPEGCCDNYVEIISREGVRVL